MALKDTEYMYISARIKAREGQTTYSARIKGYLECKTLSELCNIVLPGVSLDAMAQRDALESYFDGAVKSAFELVRESAPDPKCFDFLLYEYDACNLKTLIKGTIRDVSVDGMLYEIGTVSIEDIRTAVSTRHTENVLAPNMASALGEAYEAYSKTKDARVIDFIIDRACFADMLENARLCGSDLAIELVKTRIDGINISTLQRIVHSSLADKQSTLDMAFIPGGQIPLDLLLRVLDDSEYSLLDALEGTKYRDIVRSLGEGFGFFALERAMDMAYLALIDEVKYIPFGVEVVCSYLVNTLFEAKNARIIIAGIASGLDEEKIRERARI